MYAWISPHVSDTVIPVTCCRCQAFLVIIINLPDTKTVDTSVFLPGRDTGREDLSSFWRQNPTCNCHSKRSSESVLWWPTLSAVDRCNRGRYTNCKTSFIIVELIAVLVRSPPASLLAGAVTTPPPPIFFSMHHRTTQHNIRQVTPRRLENHYGRQWQRRSRRHDYDVLVVVILCSINYTVDRVTNRPRGTTPFIIRNFRTNNPRLTMIPPVRDRYADYYTNYHWNVG